MSRLDWVHPAWRANVFLEHIHSRGQHLWKFKEKKKFLIQEKSPTPTGFLWNTNMAAVSLFWNTNMAAVSSDLNTLYMRIVGPRLGGRGWLYHHERAGYLARRSLFLPSQLFVTHVTESSPKGNPNAVFKLYHNPLLFTCISESLQVVSEGKFQLDLRRFILLVSSVSCLARSAQNAVACVACTWKFPVIVKYLFSWKKSLDR